MFKSYLPAKYNTWLIIVQFLLLIFGAYRLVLIFFTFHIAVYVLFRRSPNHFRDNPVTTSGVVFSPCNGKIISIEEVETSLKISISIMPWKEMGLFLPISSEIKNLWRTGKEVILELDTRNNLIELHFIRRALGFWPELIVRAGDKGARQVNMGFFPLGGVVVLYLPKKYEILVKNLNEVISGETILAVLPEKL